VTYSIASLFKRVFVICFAILWFGQSVSNLQWLGIILTFFGLYLYNDSKTKKEVAINEAVVRRHERENSFSLPTSNPNQMEELDLNIAYSNQTQTQATSYSPRTYTNSQFGNSQTQAPASASAPPPPRSYPSNISIHPMFSQPQNLGLNLSPSGGSEFRDFSSSSPISSNIPLRKVSGSSAPAATSIPPSGSNIHSFVKDPRGSLPSPPESGRSSAEEKLQ